MTKSVKAQESNGKNIASFVFAVVVHGILLGVLMYHIDWNWGHQTPQIEVIQSRLLDEKQVQEEIDRFNRDRGAKERQEKERLEALRKAADEAEKKRLAEEDKQKDLEHQRLEAEKQQAEEQKRLEEEARKRAEELKKQQEAEAARVADLKKQADELAIQKKAEEERLAKLQAEADKRKKEEDAHRKAEDEKKRKETEAKKRQEDYEKSLDQMLSQESEMLENETKQDARAQALATMKQQYHSEIIAKINRNWIVPMNAPANFECTIEVTQIPGGTVAKVNIKGCSDISDALVKSFESAVLAASPLPTPQDPAVFESKVTLKFRPPKDKN